MGLEMGDGVMMMINKLDNVTRAHDDAFAASHVLLRMRRWKYGYEVRRYSIRYVAVHTRCTCIIASTVDDDRQGQTGR